MCLIAFDWRPGHDRPLVMAANRDESYERPTAAAGWWPGASEVYGGRDLLAGGSWLAMDRGGRLAAVTNVREAQPVLGRRSRGELVSGFLLGELDLHDYAQQVADAADDYSGFNLLLFETRGEGRAFYVSNRAPVRLAPVPAGVHGLSNHLLDTDWPKVRRLVRRLADATDSTQPLEAALLQALADRELPPDDELPDTGVGAERERLLAPAFIYGPARSYGTRASTVVVVDRDGTDYIERSWRPGAEGPVEAGTVRARIQPGAARCMRTCAMPTSS
ncbi:MAG: NRDE family protein [Burkholderiaceae bacterium]